MAARFVATQAPPSNPQLTLRGPFVAAASSDNVPGSLVTWYLGLIPHWMGGHSRLRTRLLLRTHQWIVDRVLAPEVSLAVAAAELQPQGALVRTLNELVPAAESEGWRQFIQAVVANLRHALLLPVTRRNEAWVRWLFLIPYSVKTLPPADRPVAAPATP
jgi:hypothetical protein